jgi:hypothetical protein
MTGSVAERAVVVYQNQNACKVQASAPLSMHRQIPRSGTHSKAFGLIFGAVISVLRASSAV